MSPQLFMFCGDEIRPDQLTREHFVPIGLWEKGYRPQKVRTLPAHRTCIAQRWIALRLTFGPGETRSASPASLRWRAPLVHGPMLGDAHPA
jgi:hypothetical protein